MIIIIFFGNSRWFSFEIILCKSHLSQMIFQIWLKRFVEIEALDAYVVFDAPEKSICNFKSTIKYWKTIIIPFREIFFGLFVVVADIIFVRKRYERVFRIQVHFQTTMSRGYRAPIGSRVEKARDLRQREFVWNGMATLMHEDRAPTSHNQWILSCLFMRQDYRQELWNL